MRIEDDVRSQAMPSASICSAERIYGLRTRLLAGCFSITRCPQEAEDLCSATLVRAVQRRAQFCGERLDSWLFSIAKSIYINEWKKWRGRSVGLEDWDEAGRSPVQEIENRLMRNQILEWINDLPPGQRICVKLAHVDGLKAAEIADITGWTREQVHKYLEHGRANLRKRYLESMKPRKDH